MQSLAINTNELHDWANKHDGALGVAAIDCSCPISQYLNSLNNEQLAALHQTLAKPIEDHGRPFSIHVTCEHVEFIWPGNIHIDVPLAEPIQAIIKEVDELGQGQVVSQSYFLGVVSRYTNGKNHLLDNGT